MRGWEIGLHPEFRDEDEFGTGQNESVFQLQRSGK